MINPSNSTVLANIPISSPEELELAVQSAATDQKKWAKVDIKKRADLILQLCSRAHRAGAERRGARHARTAGAAALEHAGRAERRASGAAAARAHGAARAEPQPAHAARRDGA